MTTSYMLVHVCFPDSISVVMWLSVTFMSLKRTLVRLQHLCAGDVCTELQL